MHIKHTSILALFIESLESRQGRLDEVRVETQMRIYLSL